MSLPLALHTLAAPRSYHFVTTSSMRMNEAEDQNTYRSTVQLTLLEKKPNNTSVLQVDILRFEAEKSSFFTDLAADLNQVSNSLIIQTDIYGRFEAIENKKAMQTAWQQIRAEVVKKYKEYYPPAFFDAFGQSIATPGVFEKSLRHKGVHGVLLAGIYGYGYTPEAPVHGRRVLEQFINHIDLPLLTTTTLQPAPVPANDLLHLRLMGTLNEAAFRADDLRRMLRTMADNPVLKVRLTATCTEEYQVETTTGWLRQAEQYLLVEVPGIYRNEVRHRLQPAD